jgi:hypothetical protein
MLTHLLTLKLDFNKLTSVKLDPLPYLQHASFTNNKIKTTEGIFHPKLEVLNLNSKNFYLYTLLFGLLVCFKSLLIPNRKSNY